MMLCSFWCVYIVKRWKKGRVGNSGKFWRKPVFRFVNTQWTYSNINKLVDNSWVRPWGEGVGSPQLHMKPSTCCWKLVLFQVFNCLYINCAFHRTYLYISLYTHSMVLFWSLTFVLQIKNIFRFWHRFMTYLHILELFSVQKTLLLTTWIKFKSWIYNYKY